MKKYVKGFASALVIPGLLLLSACGSETSKSTNTDNTNKETATNNETSNIKERTLKAGIGLNEDTPLAAGLKKFAEIVEQESGGKIKVQNYFAAQLGDDQKMTESLQGGIQDITIPSTSPLVGMVKEFGMFDFPFIFNDEKEADAVLDGPVGQKVLELLPNNNLIGLAYWENGFRNLTNSKHPVEKADDFKGLKIRTMQNQIHLEAFSALGANPTPMAFSEVFSALESKTVDGQENPLSTIESNKFYEVQPYLSLTNHVYTPFAFLFSKKTWDDMSDEERAIIKEAAIEAGKFQREENRKAQGKALENIKAAGTQVNEVSVEEKAKIAEVIKPTIDKFSQNIGTDLVNEMYEEINKVRK